MIFRVKGSVNPEMQGCFFVYCSRYAFVASSALRGVPGGSWMPMGSQRCSQNSKKSTPEQQGRLPGRAQTLPGGLGWDLLHF